jgi:cell fate regulator YaaT (PSP1 superfamily)
MTSPGLEDLTSDGQRRSIAARLRVVGQVRHYSVEGAPPKHGSGVMVRTDKGPEHATVITRPEHAAPTDDHQLPEVLRPLNQDDQARRTRHKKKEGEAFDLCKTRIKAMELSMKLISAHINHSGSHTTFYFTAGQRVDFRTLVKTLAQAIGTRVEMRQIGVRDAARHTGGAGLCGAELCCSTWLPEFKPISIRMAKEQNLALNHQKLSGVCGRLRCCLEYEHDVYKKTRQGLPKMHKQVVTPLGEGKVRDLNVLKRRVRVQLSDGSMKEFDASQLSRPEPQNGPDKPGGEAPKKSKKRKRPKKNTAATAGAPEGSKATEKKEKTGVVTNKDSTNASNSGKNSPA